jgi:hypothetical protein
MAKNITVKLTKAGSRMLTFNIQDNLGNTLEENVTKERLSKGITYSVNSNVSVVILTSVEFPSIVYNMGIVQKTQVEISKIEYNDVDTASIWKHLQNPELYNSFYGKIVPYVIEYAFGYKFQDEILQNVRDYTKAYKHFPNDNGVFFDAGKIELDREYFNKAILYNGQQSSGILNLVAKPKNNLSEYMKYPLYSSDSKTITYTKSDNFYQYNTFWALNKDKAQPLFVKSCESTSVDKVINQSNMDYSKRSFKKAPLRAKELKIRHILDDRDHVHLVSQFILVPSQISYK